MTNFTPERMHALRFVANSNQGRTLRKLSREIKSAAVEFWIEHNHLVATGRKVGEEWLDE